MSAFIGAGTVLKLDGVEIAEVVSIAGPTMQVASVDVPGLNVMDGKRSVPGIPDYGEVSATINFNPATATHATLLGLIATPMNKDWSIAWSNDEESLASWNGHLTGLSVGSTESETILTADVTIKVNGAITWA